MPTDETGSRDAAAGWVGQVLAGRYRIVELLGAGAMGAVYVGEHLRIGRRDAIKVLRTSMARDPEAMARFTRGARNLSAIRHPNVCTIYDFGDTPDGLQFLAMELVDGETLKDVLDREGRLELNRAAGIALQIADALGAAHGAGIVHRDLKPGNVMLARNADGSDAVKVVDFDIAKGPAEAEGEEVTRLGFVVGTPEYMSPEQLTGEVIDGRSDIYSLGILLFRMVAGASPFHASSTQELMVQRLTTLPKRLDEVPPGATFPPALQRVLDRALARDVHDRQASAAELASELSAVTGATAALGPGVDSIDHARARSRDDVRAREAVPPTVTARAPGARPPVEPVQPRPWRRPSRVAAAIIAIIAFAAGVRALVKPGAEPDPIAAADSSARVSQADSVRIDAAPEDTFQPDPPAPENRDVANVPPDRPDRPVPDDPPPADPSPRSPLTGGIAGALDRQLVALAEAPEPARLRAIRDTAQMAWQNARSRTDSATAAFALAQAALLANDDAECRRWTRAASELGARGIDPLRQVCG
ncbi:MAG: serine/threonine-protein kinase [Longimicrobiales bacterium]